MACLGHGLEIPEDARVKSKAQWARYLLSRGKVSLEHAFFGSGNYAKREFVHQRKIFFYKYLNLRLEEQKRDKTKPKKTQTEILLEVMPVYMHGDGPWQLSVESILDGRRRWNRRQRMERN